jgi:hypothetical protein
VRQALAVLALGLLLVVPGVHAAGAQTTTPSPPETATASSSTSEPSSTTTRPLIAPEGNSGGFSAAGEGFPWIPTGVGILVAGLIGSRLRRASRR